MGLLEGYLAFKERIGMRLNVINLIDNLEKLNNYATNPNPMISQVRNLPENHSWLDVLNNAQNCLIFEHKPTAAFKLFKLLLENGKNGIIITRNHPDKINAGAVSKKN